ncbi:MAG: helix-turn-helix transcriptional regulator [Dehalococcoidia bacterium]|jgi:DNA-binding XRE family transcriptional regulator
MYDLDMDNVWKWREKNPLRAWRVLQGGMFQSTVALRIGVATQTVRDWEAGSRNPNPDNFAALAHFMGVDIQALADQWDNWIAAARVNR